MGNLRPCQASFESIPPEILLHIIRHVPDLRSLHSSALAAPSVFRLWGDFGANILQTITSNRIVTTPQVRDLILLVALLRSGEMPAWSLDIFVEQFMRPTMMNQPPEPSCVVPSPSACPFSVLTTASRIYNLTQSCLEHYLDKLRAVQPRLRRPADPKFSYMAPYGPDELMVPGWQRQTDGVPYNTPYMGPASWEEAQVVLRAFWRLQMFHDFKRAALNSRLTAFPRLDVERIVGLRLEELFPCVHPHMTQYHEILSVSDYLQEPDASTHLIDRPPGRKVDHMTGPPEIPKDAYCLVSYTGKVRHLSYVPDGLWRRPWIHPIHQLIHDEQSPIRGVSFEVFRRLGFVLWDENRLAALGLAQTPPVRGQKPPPVKGHWTYWYSWRSILSKEELSQVEMRLEAEEAAKRRREKLRDERWMATGSWE
ncbi:hypothetical protein DL764_009337 [Monosporascus ibericus]|uniref:F-box domain-containing protein n=1 Tax=Monosporascus ibericus TaxID=155417 RepID=A0A4Q4SY49_9PEZI|nr:hypothetical protein DL764_009337 [Monosporascus ibericus]